MSRQFLLPDLGEGLTEAEIVGWLVAPGDTVTVDQPVVEVESAKSVVELPSPFAGVVESLHAAAGQTVHAGEPLLSIRDRRCRCRRKRAGCAGGCARDGVAGADGDGCDGGCGDVRRGVRRSIRSRADRLRAAAAEPYRPRHTARTLRRASRGQPAFGGVRRALAGQALPRRVAAGAQTREGPRLQCQRPGRKRRGIARAALGRAVAHRVAGRHRGSAVPGDIRIPITGVRKLVSEKMARSRREIPEATIWLDVDATALIEAKEYLQRSTGDRWRYSFASISAVASTSRPIVVFAMPAPTSSGMGTLRTPPILYELVTKK